ncbi:aspartyl-tRNA(Asn)/glutamyl-tRNA(Gln) amidotransferase subunit C [Dehalogenimonas formicexedens]|uniref:Aspartyl/glutamyl-tRNA(Asn/Gln) amidotransferase subunit C n=1 Tax=Dehalogenimonas formicexedens TaxID=1839801 RepID=A0A1P8F5I1_9CHLR|nr:Asp-tRNA(Asn)/Glu-tRNA(Gln) amidotransferase subunit GatC [Dehalogenimonas formicexedens]APV43746.1 aspartyl-tRNA(Asn)/glutamyl-tRNA(Gln) amidotransferase subunit C [Dehalogenimonas formicexedens]
MELSKQEVLHIARLARLGIDDAEVDRLRGQLSDILGHFTVLSHVNTENVPPTAHTIAQSNVLGYDKPTPCLATDQVLSNAPEREGDYFRIRAVLE